MIQLTILLIRVEVSVGRYSFKFRISIHYNNNSTYHSTPFLSNNDMSTTNATPPQSHLSE